MMSTAGFYKFEEELLRFAPNAVYAPNFTLLVSLQETYNYPIEGWHYFATTEDAESFFAINGQSEARWVEFGAAVQASEAINQLLGTALQQLPALGLGLGIEALTVPPPAQNLGQEWTSPTGTLYRVAQATGEDGQFLPDDPGTPPRESLRWVVVEP